MPAGPPDYRRYFVAGERIRVTIPPREDSLQRWGAITALQEDLLAFTLDGTPGPFLLPAKPGDSLELQVSAGGSFYRCRALLVGETDGEEGEHLFQARLVGEVINDDLRDYFRIDVFLPVWSSQVSGVSADEARERWLRRLASFDRRSMTPDSFFRDMAGGAAEDGGAHLHPAPVAANISGGGMRLTLPEPVQPGDLVDLLLYLPTRPPKVLDIVGKAVQVTPLPNAAGETQEASVALTFLHITEPERDELIGFISRSQLAQMREQRRGQRADPLPRPFSRWRALLVFVYGFLAALVLLGIVRGLVNYYRHHEKHEIEQVFEEQIRKYMEKFK